MNSKKEPPTYLAEVKVEAVLDGKPNEIKFSFDGVRTMEGAKIRARAYMKAYGIGRPRRMEVTVYNPRIKNEVLSKSVEEV